jgi:hypothetical protein
VSVSNLVADVHMHEGDQPWCESGIGESLVQLIVGTRECAQMRINSCEAIGIVAGVIGMDQEL